MKRLSFAFVLSLGVAALSSAASLNLEYLKTNLGGGMYGYDFTLSVDTSSSGFTNGMGWAWLIFGDAQSSGSPMADFQMTSSFPVGPWTYLTSSGGYHNGPTFGNVSTYWYPGSAGDTLQWSGKSSWNAPDGQLLFSTLLTTGGATAATFKPATPVPEPATLLVLAGGTLLLRRRRSR